MFGMRLSAPLWYPTLQALWPEVTQFVFVHNASIMYFLLIKKEKRCDVLGAEQQAHILSVSVKLLSNCCRAAGGADICFSPISGCRPCRSQSPGMPHTFCLFYMSKQIVKSHQFTSILSYLKFIGGNHLVECPAVAMETKGPAWTSEGLGTCKI